MFVIIRFIDHQNNFTYVDKSTVDNFKMLVTEKIWLKVKIFLKKWFYQVIEREEKAHLASIRMIQFKQEKFEIIIQYFD